MPRGLRTPRPQRPLGPDFVVISLTSVPVDPSRLLLYSVSLSIGLDQDFDFGALNYKSRHPAGSFATAILHCGRQRAV
jgi:hypothetical protein